MKIFSTLFTFRAQATPVVKLLAMDLAALLNQGQPKPKKRPACAQRHVEYLESDSDTAADAAGHQHVAAPEVGQDPPDPQVADCWPAVGNMPVPLYLKHSHPWVAKGSLPSTEVSAGAIVSGLLLVCFDVITQCKFQLLSNTNLVQQS